MKKYLPIFLLLFFSTYSYTQDQNKEVTDRIYLDLGYQKGTEEFSSDYFNAQIIYGIQSRPKFTYGVGASYRTNQLEDLQVLALFFNTKSRVIPAYRNLLIDVGIGYNAQIDDDLSDGGVLFFAGLQNQIAIERGLDFLIGLSYDVMRIEKFNSLILYNSINLKMGIAF